MSMNTRSKSPCHSQKAEGFKIQEPELLQVFITKAEGKKVI